PGDLQELLRVERLRSHDRGLNAGRAKLGNERRRGEEVSRHVDHVGIVALDARNNGAELAVLERVAVFAENLYSELVDGALETLECRLAIVVVHGDDGHALEAEIVAEKLGRRTSLRRPQMYAAENVIAAARDVGMDAIGGDERNSGLLKNGRGSAPRRRVASGDRKF